MAVEYQLHGERNSDIFRFQRNIGRSEARIGFMGFMLQKWKNDVTGVLITLIPGILRGWEFKNSTLIQMKTNVNFLLLIKLQF